MKAVEIPEAKRSLLSLAAILGGQGVMIPQDREGDPREPSLLHQVYSHPSPPPLPGSWLLRAERREPSCPAPVYFSSLKFGVLCFFHFFFFFSICQVTGDPGAVLWLEEIRQGVARANEDTSRAQRSKQPGTGKAEWGPTLSHVSHGKHPGEEGVYS